MQINRPEIYDGLPWSELDPSLLTALPKTKEDIDKAKEIINLGFPKNALVLPHLLRWMQDFNWPVAKEIAPFLASVGEPLLPVLQPVLSGNDDIWIYWVLTELASKLPDPVLRKLSTELSVLSKRSSKEGVDEIAKELLQRI